MKSQMNNDHLTAPMLSAAMDEVIALRTRVEELEAALRDVAFAFEATENAEEKMYYIARAALDKDAVT